MSLANYKYILTHVSIGPYSSVLSSCTGHRNRQLQVSEHNYKRQRCWTLAVLQIIISYDVYLDTPTGYDVMMYT